MRRGYPHGAMSTHVAERLEIASERPEVVIRPPGRFGGLGLKELTQHHELLYFLVKRELQVRYKQSLFGVAWAVLQPVALAFIFALFFGRLAKLPSEGVPYPVFALAGLVPWMFAAQATSQAATSLVGDANLLSKVYFPRLVIPLGKVLSLSVDLLLSLCVLFPFVLLYGVDLEPRAFAVIPFVLMGVFAVIGIGIGLSALNVKYRDITVAIPLLIQVWLFATPVVYPGSLVTGAWQYIYALNPMVSVITGVRWAVLGTPAPAIGPLLVSLAVIVVTLFAALVYFKRTERFFADLI
jgi:lipopolysaccharide transport system permease protein